MNDRTTTNNYRASLDAALRRLENDAAMHQETRDAILRFQGQMATEGLSIARRMKCVSTLRLIFSGSPKPVRDWTKDDVADFVRRIESKDYAAWTLYDFRVVLRRFFKWLRGTKNCYPPEVEDLRTSSKKSVGKLPEEVLSEEEVGRMIAVCERPRDAAFLACLYETGCRPDELGSLRLKHVQPDTYGFVLVVNGKTGTRRVRVCLFAHHLAAWMDRHPRADDPEAVLWMMSRTADGRRPPSNQLINKITKQAARSAGIRKRVYPYIFRHSRATYLASRLTEAQMNMVFGWKQGSDMPRTYVHLSGRDVDGALLALAGVTPADARPKESILKPRVCGRCAATNPGTARFCQRCVAPLDSAEVFHAETDAMAAGRLIADLLRDDPAIQAILKERIKKKLLASAEACADTNPEAGQPAAFSPRTCQTALLP